jgi:putative ABC transport system ATP-binding protein
MTAPGLEVRDLTVDFSSGGYIVRPLDNLSFDALDGEFVALIGPSGCGKTTLLSCLAGLLTPTHGTIQYRDIDVTGLSKRALATYRRDTVGVVFQAFNLIASLTARGNVVAPMRLAGMDRRHSATRADELLARVGLAERLRYRPRALSGGQQQRVAIARALVHEPPLVLADEPTAHLDHIQVEGILTLLRELAAHGRTVIVSTHDDRVTNLADRVIDLAPHLATADREPEEFRYAAGEEIFHQGSRGDLIYIVEAGDVEIVRNRDDGTDEMLAVVTAGNYFGELGPMLNLPRSATARAKTDVVLTGYTNRRFRLRM